MERHHCEGFLAAGRLSTIRSTRYDTLYHPALFSFKHLVRHNAPDIVKVDGFDFDVGKMSLLSNTAHSTMRREKLVINILNRLLQSDDVPFPANCFSMAPYLPRRVLDSGC